MPIFVQDTFTGSGVLTDHVGEIGATWNDESTGGTANCTLSGGVVTFTTQYGGAASGTNLYNSGYITATFRAAATQRCSMWVRFFISGVTTADRPGVLLDMAAGGATNGTFYRGDGSWTDFAATWAAGTDVVVRLEVTPTQCAVLVDGTPVFSESGTFNVLNARVFVEPYDLSGGGNMSMTYLEAGTLGSATPVAFWTDHTNATEIDL